MTTLSSLQRTLEQRKGKKLQTEENLTAARKKVKRIKKNIGAYEEAQAIIQTVAQSTQKSLEYHISSLVSLALDGVFPQPYKLGLDFTLRRGKSEADLFFEKENGERVHPLSASGGGAVDVAAFALRVSLWSLANPRSSSTIILDEPFRFLSRDLQEKASQMVKEISERLGTQFIIVTHERSLVEAADMVFEVKQIDGVSKVEEA